MFVQFNKIVVNINTQQIKFRHFVFVAMQFQGRLKKSVFQRLFSELFANCYSLSPEAMGSFS